MSKNLVKIGCITEARSLQGEVWFHVFTGEASWAHRLKTLFLSVPASFSGGGALPLSKPLSPSTNELVSLENLPPHFAEYKVSSLKEQSGRFVLKLQGVNDRNAAEALRGSIGWIPESFLKSKKGETIFLREVLGFQVYDGKKLLGPVVSFESNGPQDLLVVEVAAGRTVLIPFIKEFIVKISSGEKIIAMELPAGLVEVALGDSESNDDQKSNEK